METLSVDLETFSSVDLTKCGVCAYTDSDDFEILLFAYALNDDPVKVVDLANGEVLPHSVAAALFDPNIIKTAFNANFERTCLAKHLGRETPPEQWHCTAVHALTLGLPQSLGQVGKALDLCEDKQKMSVGTSLIRYFCIPCKPTQRNSGRTRNLPKHDPEKWKLFKDYCARDVETERTIRQKLIRFDVHPDERRLWALDQQINDRGVRVDQEMVKHAIRCDTDYAARLEAEAVKLTELDNPKSVAQLKKWLADAEGIEVESLSKETVPELLKQTNSETVRRVLELRQEMSRTSVKKYEAMQRSVCKDSRIRGLLQFYGARTGRWVGRLVQVQNLPQNHLEDLDLARRLLCEGDFETLELLFGNVPDTLSQLIRTAFIPAEGHRFIVADFSAIEARVIAWLAGEKWRLDVFKTHGKIYEASASQMFKVPIEQITKGSPLRQRGKVAELALGYQGGKGALLKMDKKKELNEDELPDLVNAWRKASPNIVQLWRDAEAAAIGAVQERMGVPLHHGVVYSCESGILFVKLPSGRRLAYAKPKIKTDERFGKPALTYEGLNQETKQWGRLDTYGGKLVENLVQAIARDCLAVAMLRLTEAGYKIVFHVHDEFIIEAPEGAGSVKHVAEIAGQPIPWAPGLPLRADGYETSYYKKD